MSQATWQRSWYASRTGLCSLCGRSAMMASNTSVCSDCSAAQHRSSHHREERKAAVLNQTGRHAVAGSRVDRAERPRPMPRSQYAEPSRRHPQTRPNPSGHYGIAHSRHSRSGTRLRASQDPVHYQAPRNDPWDSWDREPQDYRHDRHSPDPVPSWGGSGHRDRDILDDFGALSIRRSDREMAAFSQFSDPWESMFNQAFGGFPHIQQSSAFPSNPFARTFEFLPQRQSSILQAISASLGFHGDQDFDDFQWGPMLDFNQLFAHITAMRPDQVHPASPNAVQHLQSVSVSRENEVKGEICTVCQERLKRGETVKKLSCAHLFHEECVVPWLQTHNTCPVCRQEVS